MNRPSSLAARDGRSVTRDGRSVAARAASVLLLALGFYALALGLIGFFLWIPWAEMAYGAGLSPAGFVCGIAGLFFAYAILPRWPGKRPERPDPLKDGAHPRLRQLISGVAKEVGERAPDQIYLVPEANAFTGKEGGFLGIGSKSVVGIGLPLLATLSEDELRAVLAHEFGHHKGGDLRLGPFVHRTRMAVAGAIERLDGSSFLLHWPFLLYANLFLRISRQISREQELAADALAAKVVGADAAGRALSRIESLAPRWDAYFLGEVIPLISAGYRPPMLEGFRTFLSRTPWRADVTRLVLRREHRAPREHDTHPALAERLEAMGLGGTDPRAREERLRRREGQALPAQQAAFVSATPALGLLDAAASAETEALSTVLKKDAPVLKEVAWEGIGESAWVPLWRGSLSRIRATLGKLKVSAFPDVLDAPEDWWQRFHPGVLSLLSPLGTQRGVAATLGTYFTLVCADAGFDIEVPPGGETVATRDGVRLEPEVLVRQLASGELSRRAFLDQVVDLGLADRAGFLERTPPKAKVADGEEAEPPHAS